MKTKFFIMLLSLTLAACHSESIQTVVNTIPPELTITPSAAVTLSPTPDLAARDIWIQRASMFTPRSEMPAVALHGMIYVPGGFGPVPGGLANGKGPVTTFDVYNPIADKWQSLAPMPEPRHHEMVTVYKEKVYVFGGFVDPWITQSNAWAYDATTDQWEVLKPMPAPRTAGAAVTLDDYIYLIGGTTSPASVVLPTWRYDPETDTWQDVAPLQEPREHTTAVVLDGKIYALGGRWIDDLNSVEIYDPASDQWTFGIPMQEARSGFGAAVMDGKIYVAGGELINILKALKSVEVFDPATKAWSFLPNLPGPLHGVPLVAVDGTLYVIGGSGRAGDVINAGRMYSYRP